MKERVIVRLGLSGDLSRCGSEDRDVSDRVKSTNQAGLLGMARSLTQSWGDMRVTTLGTSCQENTLTAVQRKI